MEEAAAPLREAWYYAAPSRAVRRGRLHARVMLGEPVVLGRDGDGTAFALRDICPHRGMPLSAGNFDGREIECCYHGWRFAADGACTAIPALVDGQKFDLARVCVRAYPVHETQGNIWVYLGDKPEAAPGIPALDGFGADAEPRDRRAGVVQRGDRRCGGRADGPRARPVCPPSVVVARTALDPRKIEAVRAVAVGVHDEPPRPVNQLAGLQDPRWCALDGDRLSASERARRTNPHRPPRRVQPHRDHP